MKKTMTIFGAILFASFIFSSCGGDSSKEPETTTEEPAAKTEEPAAAAEEPAAATEEPVAKTEEKATESNNDCDQFIKDYEEFVDSYIVIIKKMKANPTDMTILSEYTEMAKNAATMQTNAGNCADSKYAAKLTKLATKMAKAAAGM
jgi:hypothetical protein